MRLGTAPSRVTHDLSAGVVIATASAVVAMLAAGRVYLTFGTESDFGMFVLAAKRVASGGPLLLAFHPPLYPATLALVHPLVGDWVHAGLIISVVAFAGGLIATYALFCVAGHRCLGRGALLAVATSPLLISYGAQATSDTFFFALYTAVLFFVVRAWQAQTSAAWFVSGVTMALATLTRTNGLTLLLLAAAPLLATGDRRDRLRWAGAAAAGAGLALGAWGAIALATGSPLWPTSVAFNLALTYLAPGTDRKTQEAAAVLPDSLPGIVELLLSRPGIVARTYAHDAITMAEHLVRGDGLTVLPVGVVLLPGLVLLFRILNRRVAWMLGIATVAQAGAVNFKAYESRFLMFAIPVIGAAAAAVARAVWERLDTRRARLVAAALAASIAVVSLAGALDNVRSQLHAQDVELGEAVTAARRTLQPGAVLVTRKGHLAHYVGASDARLPMAATLEELRAKLERIPGQPLYLYFGSEESRRRPGLRGLLRADAAPPWLSRVAESQPPGTWVLYRYVPTSQ